MPFSRVQPAPRGQNAVGVVGPEPAAVNGVCAPFAALPKTPIDRDRRDTRLRPSVPLTLPTGRDRRSRNNQRENRT